VSPARILVITAVDAERDAVLRTLSAETTEIGRYEARVAASGAGEVTVIAGGIGMAASAAATATAFALGSYDVAVSMGIGGGFDGRAQVGDVVIATDVLACELGADSPEGFHTFGELGLLDTGLATAAPVDRLAHRLNARTGRILTVSTVTGTDARALELAERWDPAAEGMEGFGVWSTVQSLGTVVPLEIRAVSNRAGRRDRPSWDIAGALDALSASAEALFRETLL
jgi:futalosine hydrolase